MSWQLVSINSFLSERKGRYKPDDKEIAGLERIEKIDFSGEIHLSDKPSKTNMILVRDGDLVISGINVEKGAMAVYRGKKDVKATIHYSSYEYNANKIDLDFLKYFLKSPEFKAALKEQVPGGIKTEIKPKHLLPLKILIPTDIDDQKLIVDTLKTRNSILNKQADNIILQLDFVKQLRQAFLKEAMQGKLTAKWREENPDVEPASELLKRIKAEKEQLIKEKKIKKQKPLPPILEDEIPFDIPGTWEWCRLGEICELITSGSRNWNKYYSKTGDLFIRSQNIKAENLNLVEKAFVQLPQKIEGKRTSLLRKDILITITGAGVSNSALVEEIESSVAYVSQHVALIRLIEKTIAKWLHKAIISENIGKAQFAELIYGDKPGLNLNQIGNLIVPLPPVIEQYEIEQKLEEGISLCDNLAESIKASQQQNEMLLQQVLREALNPEKKEISLKARKCNPSEKAILAGHIINQTNTEDFGRVKFQKLLYLVEHHLKLDLDSNYKRKVAGPHDGNLLREIESTLERLRFYRIEQSHLKNHRVNYTALNYASELDNLFIENFEAESKGVDTFLSIFKKSTWEQCEIIATMYAVWNNRIIKNQPISDDLLKHDFLNWDKQKIKYKDRLDGALVWMREDGIVPDGWGKLIDKPK
uniref:restriction endonuclease subunit S n=1 Tax=uncultured Draconibacterium sp. TaxID=1573823 RepID=UPI003216F2EE